ncbi:dTDP-4-dehydrorhamnose reductase [Novosphingobium jiangmenense]|uniref:dTDP-4-dehydrorhamnose reductase n=1 Tax=Novosphingobium jiangmenense TaxID=2791981 RepID=A0ABS0HLQ4_9SPHN|nr:dTDP-4-dehydrorhamnose reductase [Novosphingobium jiangmenense]MBF9153058.1 dTDP-4-dehydrorhamnose reductase [Novosphingobium jiangmenense]
MKILVTGRNGQVTRAIMECSKAQGHKAIVLARPQFDLATSDVSTVRRLMSAAAPDLVVSAAAYTAVDQAETDEKRALAANVGGAEQIAICADELRIPLIHLSTDYVFSGENGCPWREHDEPAPRSVYGYSKLLGERAVANACSDHAILRTAWVYSPFGTNFVKTMLRLAQRSEAVSVVGDQVGNPTSAHDLAAAVIAVGSNMVRSRDPALRGVFHAAGMQEASWADFAKGIFDLSRSQGGPHAEVIEIATADYPTRASRPANSRLDCSRLASVHNHALPGWRHSLPGVLARILAESRSLSVSAEVTRR